jgi:hypothetical protein
MGILRPLRNLVSRSFCLPWSLRDHSNEGGIRISAGCADGAFALSHLLQLSGWPYSQGIIITQ